MFVIRIIKQASTTRNNYLFHSSFANRSQRSSSSTATVTSCVGNIRTFSSPSTTQLPDIKLYQYSICPFCNIVKAVLDYSSVKYETVEVNPLTKSEIKWSESYKKVPIAVVSETPIFGSEQIVKEILSNISIVSHLEETKWKKEHNTNNTTTHSQFMDSAQSDKWYQFAVEELAPLLYPNICSTISDSYLAFGYVNRIDSFSLLQKITIRTVGSVAMYVMASKVKQKRGIPNEKEREALWDSLQYLNMEGLDGGKQKFLSGEEKPNLGDLAVFGTIRSIEGLAAHEFILKGARSHKQDESAASTTIPYSIPEWYERMREQVSSAQDEKGDKDRFSRVERDK